MSLRGIVNFVLDYSRATTSNRLVVDVSGRQSVFFDVPGRCPTCSRVGWNVIRDELYFKPGDAPCEMALCVGCDEGHYDPCLEETYKVSVWVCVCGWWDIYAAGLSGSDSVDPMYELPSRGAHSLLRVFDTETIDVVLSALRHALVRTPLIMHDLTPYATEQLVGDVLRGLHDGEVVHCGRSGDGGVDLMLLQGASTTAIQIKRRRCHDAVEAVAPVRELVAAAQLHGCKAATYVTTASKFSTPAQKTAVRSVELGLLTRYDLVDAARFIDLVKRRSTDDEPWARAVNALLQGFYRHRDWYAVPKVTEYAFEP